MEIRSSISPNIDSIIGNHQGMKVSNTLLVRNNKIQRQRINNATRSTMFPLVQASNNNNITAGFIHMGKTGGSNLARLLINGCHSFKPKPCKKVGSIKNETIVSRLVSDYYHITEDTAKISSSNHSIYILTTRDVYERFTSAFTYMHPRNKATFKRKMSGEDMIHQGRAYRCFKSLQSFADAIGRDRSWEFYYPRHWEHRYGGNCTNLARASAAGHVSVFIHMYNNYQKMWQWIPFDKNGADLYIIRQEHLWEDWSTVNRLLSGQPAASEAVVVLPDERVRRNVTGALPPPVTKQVNDKGRQNLCRALEPDYRAYLTLFRMAKNLRHPMDMQEAIAIGKYNCPDLGVFREF
jgi:hypothetical protein